MALPDLDTISTLLSVVEGRDADTVTVSRLDEDHNVLLNTQAEIADVFAGDAAQREDTEDLRAVLDRIVNDIERNRELRARAAAREASGRA
jgi:hypothetical protein